jgi:hypothetical protein
MRVLEGWGVGEVMNQQLTLEDYLKAARFEGPADNAKDFDRLCGQYRDIFMLMSDGTWRTLAEIRQATGHPEASISSQIRHSRKMRWGSNTVNKRRRNDSNQWEYQLIPRGQNGNEN